MMKIISISKKYETNEYYFLMRKLLKNDRLEMLLDRKNAIDEKIK